MSPPWWTGDSHCVLTSFLNSITNLFGIILCGSTSLKNPLRLNHPAYSAMQVPAFIDSDHEELTLAEFWNELDYSPEDFKDHHLSNHWRPKEDFGDYMNEISTNIFKSFGLGAYPLNSLVV